jgi:hypothetical protein
MWLGFYWRKQDGTNKEYCRKYLKMIIISSWERAMQARKVSKCIALFFHLPVCLMGVDCSTP